MDLRLAPRRLACLLAAFAFASPAWAEEDEYVDPVPPDVSIPTLPTHAADAAGFVPAGWVLEHSARGDLDGDGREDLLLVLRMHDPANVLRNEGLGTDRWDTNPRLLAVALAEVGDGYRLALQDGGLIPRADSPVMDDYLAESDPIRIARGAFSVGLHAWASAGSWSTSETRLTFRLQEGCFRLIGYDSDDTHRGSGETTSLSVNYLTGKARIDHGSIEDERVRTTWKKIAPAPLPCLEDVGNGMDFDPGVRVD